MNYNSDDLNPIFLTPINFFGFEVDCHKVPKKGCQKLGSHYLLPDTSQLCQEMSFADVALGWHSEGLACEVKVRAPVESVLFPSSHLGDSVEIFIDTRDMKSAGFNTRFCHHFCFLPQAVDGIAAREITHFRTEDAHELCDPALLEVQTQVKKNSYEMLLFIPKDCLHGYDADQFQRLGFTYRINRYQKQAQHFTVLSSEYQIDQMPSLWGSLVLKK